MQFDHFITTGILSVERKGIQFILEENRESILNSLQECFTAENRFIKRFCFNLDINWFELINVEPDEQMLIFNFNQIESEITIFFNYLVRHVLISAEYRNVEIIDVPRLTKNEINVINNLYYVSYHFSTFPFIKTPLFYNCNINYIDTKPEIKRFYLNQKKLINLHGIIKIKTFKSRFPNKTVKYHDVFGDCDNKKCPNKTFYCILNNKVYFYSECDKIFMEKEELFSENPHLICKSCGILIEKSDEDLDFEYNYVVSFNNHFFNSRFDKEINDEFLSSSEKMTIVGYFERNRRGIEEFRIISLFTYTKCIKYDQFDINTCKIERFLSKYVELFYKNEITKELKVLLIILNCFNVFKTTKISNVNHTDLLSSPFTDNSDESPFLQIKIYTNDIQLVKKITKQFLNDISICYSSRVEINKNCLILRHIRDVIKDKNNPSHTFILKIEGDLDYSYQKSKKRYFQNQKIMDYEAFIDEENVKEVYLELRRIYKGLKPPEDLFNTVVLLYKSVFYLTEGRFSNETVKRFVISYFMNKLY
ncbi:hypothetical protein NUSPORA_00045 [Nucleospora cyclopteri]